MFVQVEAEEPEGPESEEPKTGETLPDTATNQYNWMIAGLSLLMVGFATRLVMLRRSRKVA